MQCQKQLAENYSVKKKKTGYKRNNLYKRLMARKKKIVWINKPGK